MFEGIVNNQFQSVQDTYGKLEPYLTQLEKFAEGLKIVDGEVKTLSENKLIKAVETEMKIQREVIVEHEKK